MMVPSGGNSPPPGATVFPSWELLSLSSTRPGEVAAAEDLDLALARLSSIF